MDRNNQKLINCSKCNALIPLGSERCPECGAKIKPKLGQLTDEQIRKIRRPLTIIAWVAVIVVIYFKYFKK